MPSKHRLDAHHQMWRLPLVRHVSGTHVLCPMPRCSPSGTCVSFFMAGAATGSVICTGTDSASFQSFSRVGSSEGSHCRHRYHQQENVVRSCFLHHVWGESCRVAPGCV